MLARVNKGETFDSTRDALEPARVKPASKPFGDDPNGLGARRYQRNMPKTRHD